jgi:hypothetical protein
LKLALLGGCYFWQVRHLLLCRTLRFSYSFSQGTVDPCSGAVTLQFEAAMLVQVGSKPPTPLPLLTTLTSEPSTAYKVTLTGQRMADGRVT